MPNRVFSSVRRGPEDQTARRAYDLLTDGCGEGVSGPLIVTVEGETVADEAALAEFTRTLGETEGVAFVQPPEPIGDQLAIVTVFPDSSPQDEATAELVDRLRDETIPASGVSSRVGGFTAAALIMVCVFSAFALGDDRQLKLFGLGMAIAVALDAAVVRMLLVPATMELLGNRNWWIPRWIDRLLPSIEVEGHLIGPPPASDDAPPPPTEREPELVN